MKHLILLGLITLGMPHLAQAADLQAGKKMFNQVCSHCHLTTYEDKFGPGLGAIGERVDVAWLQEFLQSPGKMMKIDEYAQQLREGNAYSLTMPAIPEMKNESKRNDIIAYLLTLE